MSAPDTPPFNLEIASFVACQPPGKENALTSSTDKILSNMDKIQTWAKSTAKLGQDRVSKSFIIPASQVHQIYWARRPKKEAPM